MNKLPLMIAGGMALATVAASTAARADQYWVQPGTPQGQGGVAQSAPDGYTTPAPVTSGQVMVYNGNTWEAASAVPVYSPSNVDHGPQTGRGGLENNEPFPAG